MSLLFAIYVTPLLNEIQNRKLGPVGLLSGFRRFYLYFQKILLSPVRGVNWEPKKGVPLFIFLVRVLYDRFCPSMLIVTSVVLSFLV